MDKTTVLLVLVVFFFAAIVFGAVTAASETATGSNTKNGVTPGPPLPPGVTAPAGR